MKVGKEIVNRCYVVLKLRPSLFGSCLRVCVFALSFGKWLKRTLDKDCVSSSAWCGRCDRLTTSHKTGCGRLAQRRRVRFFPHVTTKGNSRLQTGLEFLLSFSVFLYCFFPFFQFSFLYFYFTPPRMATILLLVLMFLFCAFIVVGAASSHQHVDPQNFNNVQCHGRGADVVSDVFWAAPFYSGGGYCSEAHDALAGLARCGVAVRALQHGDSYNRQFVERLDAERLQVRDQLVFFCGLLLLTRTLLAHTLMHSRFGYKAQYQHVPNERPQPLIRPTCRHSKVAPCEPSQVRTNSSVGMVGGWRGGGHSCDRSHNHRFVFATLSLVRGRCRVPTTARPTALPLAVRTASAAQCSRRTDCRMAGNSA